MGHAVFPLQARAAYRNLIVEGIPWLVLYRLKVVQSQPVQCLQGLYIEVSQAAHQGCCLHGQLFESLLGLLVLVLVHL